MTRSTFCVVIPAFNAEHTISRAITSALSCEADEVIVVDDGSTDRTADVAADGGAIVIRQANTGAFAARKRGVAEASSDFIVLLDSDDSLIGEGVHASIQLLESDPSIGLVSGAAIGVRSDGSETTYRHWREPVTVVKLLQVGFGPGPPASYMWRREVLFESICGVTPSTGSRFADDYELLIRGCLRSRVRYHDRPAAHYALAGGKSERNAIQPLIASESIREHYAGLIGLKIRRRSMRKLRAASLIRLAKAEYSLTARGRLLLQAASLDPRLVMSLAAGRLGVRVDE